MEQKIEVKGNTEQATKFDGEKPQIFLIPARAWDALEFLKETFFDKKRNNIRTFRENLTKFKIGEENMTLVFAGLAVMGIMEQSGSWMQSKHQIARVFEYGAKKYKLGNWHAGDGFTWSRLIRPIEGHFDSYESGEILDPETGLPHLAHCMCCILMLLEHVLTEHGIDDRSPIQFIPSIKPFTYSNS